MKSDEVGRLLWLQINTKLDLHVEQTLDIK